eukprot:TRINITY_DN4394_c0_g1_i1.p4 TRINITY_DN4394_c0_g1~~TRINITY_DN4394_c0_g1_i1.p4  ORF type:complete len:150 (-),score=35.66 TRINITY_DN4394_c0_g1_i1:849-1298(-)
MMKIVVVAALVVSVVGFPSLYRACVLPSTGLGPHNGVMKGFGEDFAFSFTDMAGVDAVDFIPGEQYLVTVSGAVPFRMTTIADSGSFLYSDVTGEPVCDGLRVNNNDIILTHTATWVGDDADNVTFAVNLAAECINNYVQDILFVESAL